VVRIFSQFFFFFWPTKLGRTTNMSMACKQNKAKVTHTQRLTREVTAVARRQNPRGGAQLFPRHMTCPRSHELLVSSQTNSFPSSLSTRTLLRICASTPTSTRARKPSIMLKLVRLSQGNHGINWTPWSRIVGGVYSLSLILSF